MMTLHCPVSFKTCTMTVLDEIFSQFSWENRDIRFDEFPMMSSPIWAIGRISYNVTTQRQKHNFKKISGIGSISSCFYIFLHKYQKPGAFQFNILKSCAPNDANGNISVFVWPRNQLSNYLRLLTLMVDASLGVYCLGLALLLGYSVSFMSGNNILFVDE